MRRSALADPFSGQLDDYYGGRLGLRGGQGANYYDRTGGPGTVSPPSPSFWSMLAQSFLPVMAGPVLGGLVGAGTGVANAGLDAGTAATSAWPATSELARDLIAPRLLGGGGMGFLDVLKSLGTDTAKGFLQSLISPGPGGAPSAVGAVGQTAGSIEAQRARALEAAARIQQEQDRLALERYQEGLFGANTDLAQRKFGISAPGQLASNAVRGDMLANAQDATISGLPSGITVPTLSGGLRPSLLSGATRNLGGNLSRQALADQMSGKYTDFKPFPTPPESTPLPTSTGVDKGLQITAGVGGFLDALRNLMGAKAGTVPPAIPSSPPGVPMDTTDQEELSPDILEWLKQYQPPSTGASS